MTLAALMLLLIALETKHLLADYMLQTVYMVRNKGHYGHLGGLLHAAIHTAFTAMILAAAGSPMAMLLALSGLELLLHYHIDWVKEHVSDRARTTYDTSHFWQLHGVDQYLHHLTYVGIVWIMAQRLASGGPQ